MKKNCFCAFCRSPRRIFKKRNIGVLNVIYAGLAALVIMYLLWQNFDPRGLIVFAVLLAITETFIQFRWRLSIPCRQCGFDPVMYLKDPNKAAEKVTLHLEKRRADPKYLMARPLNLPAISKEKSIALQNKAKSTAKNADKKGRLVSRQA
jgi:hypothetical protein